MNLVITVIGFVVSTMFIFFVCTRPIGARIHLNASWRSFPVIVSRSHLSLLEQGFHGFEPVVVANFPTKKYSDEFFSGAENYQCTVCLSDYHGEDILRILPYCGHSFDVTCIDIWLHQHSTCPVCRISLREFPEKKHLMQPLFSSAIRSHYGIEPFDDSQSYGMVTDNSLSARTQDSHGVNSVLEGHFAPEGGRVENARDLSHGDQIIKDAENKLVEGPSNL